MTDAPTQYLPALLHPQSGITAWERGFCASVSRQERAGRRLSDKQAAALRGIVERFQQRAMKDEAAE